VSEFDNIMFDCGGQRDCSRNRFEGGRLTVELVKTFDKTESRHAQCKLVLECDRVATIRIRLLEYKLRQSNCSHIHLTS